MSAWKTLELEIKKEWSISGPDKGFYDDPRNYIAAHIMIEIEVRTFVDGPESPAVKELIRGLCIFAMNNGYKDFHKKPFNDTDSLFANLQFDMRSWLELNIFYDEVEKLERRNSTLDCYSETAAAIYREDIDQDACDLLNRWQDSMSMQLMKAVRGC